ncbi:cyclic-phosphate processing receiver domain-containing protein [Paenibacillus sp. MBLB4367]|uniref:cyclic-phosphate processing receiver domain-containing protein n=1 Tax=Paenibacillus sp. MBLB4367 TaxID=3384767 RepID=UPI003907F9F7
MIHVYLDDFRPCPKGFVHAANAEECILLLDECDIDVLSLDYDLGWHAPTGLDIVRHMIAHSRYAKTIYLHSSSAIGRQKMYELLYLHKPEAVQLFMHAMPLELLRRIADETSNNKRA